MKNIDRTNILSIIDSLHNLGIYNAFGFEKDINEKIELMEQLKSNEDTYSYGEELEEILAINLDRAESALFALRFALDGIDTDLI